MSLNVVIIGAVALGSKAACRLKRLRQDASVTLVDQQKDISYGGCGIPYYISGDVSDATELRQTSFHMLRDERFFKKDKGVDVITRTKALSINRKDKLVTLREESGRMLELPYDKLVIATGANPRRLEIPGIGLEGVYYVGTLSDAVSIKKAVTSGAVERAVIIGGGFIGLEMAEALSDMWEIETSIVEYCDQVMPGFVSSNLAMMAENLISKNNVKIHTKERVLEIIGDGKVEALRPDKRTIPADMVISAVGIEPNSSLAREAGLEVSDAGHIVVNDRMQTSDPDIYAGGDCVSIPNLITGKPGYFPLGSMANRQGRVIGTNLAGGDARFPGGVGSFVVKIFDAALAGAGLTIEIARKEGFDAGSVLVAQFDRAHFYPEKEIIFLELVFDKKTRRVLGIQGFGGINSGLLARINAVAPLLEKEAVIDDISNLEFTYSPPFASAMDIINALGNAADNFVSGRLVCTYADEFAKWWDDISSGKAFVIDCRAAADGKPYEEKYPGLWKSIPHDELADRINEIPKDKPLLLVCNTGVRSYEAQINLRDAGIDNTANLSAGMAGLRACGFDV